MEFINGFQSWAETHHEVCEIIGKYRAMDESKQPEKVRNTQILGGTCGFYELGIKITNEFEKKNAGRQWDGEFFEEIEDFVESKLNILIL